MSIKSPEEAEELRKQIEIEELELEEMTLKAKIFKMADESLNAFSHFILGYKDADHQREWGNILSNFIYRFIALAAPRSHSKTTTFSIKYPLWRIKQDRNIRILLVSGVYSQAASYLREIVGNIERNVNYIEWAGNLKPAKLEKWTDSEIIIDRDNLQLKDPTISAVGIGGTVLSKRVDEIVCDDLLTPENTRTLEQRQKVAEFVYKVLMPVLEPGGRFIIAGTVFTPGDLLTELLESPDFDFKKKYKAIISDAENQTIWDEYYEIYTQDKQAGNKFYEDNKEEMLRGAQVLWPDRYSYRELWHLRKQNSFAFAQMYQNEHVSTTDRVFKDEWIEKAKYREFRLMNSLESWVQKFGTPMDIITQGMDLAISQKATADDSAHLTLGHIIDGPYAGKYVIMNMEVDKLDYPTQKKLVKNQFHQFSYSQLSPTVVAVENVGYQDALRQDLLADNEDIPVKGYKTGKEKLDFSVGVYSLAVLMENGKLILPYDTSDSKTIRLIDMLIEAMIKFPVGHTGDPLMALWFAYTFQRQVASVGGMMIDTDNDNGGFYGSITSDDDED